MSGKDRFSTVNGLRLHYVEHGETNLPPIVCLHGGGAHGHAWDAFASRVCNRYRVLALTFRGHGDSDRADRYDAQSLNLDAAEFIRSLGVAPTVLAGHSLGGGTALAVAALWPSLVSHLVVVDASIRPNLVGWNRIVESMRERPDDFGSAEDAVAWFRQHIPGIPDAELRRYIEADLNQGADRRFRRKTDPNWGATGLAMSEEEARQMRQSAEEFGRNALKVISCPVLLVRGTRTDILDRDTAEEMASLTTNGHLVEIDAQHSVFQESPGEFAAAVAEFLAR